MISVDIFRNSAGGIEGFRVVGHSATAAHGQDIICAGVSSLTQTAVLGIERQLGRKMRLDVVSGKLVMELCEQPDDLTGAILETMLLGLIEIAKIKPQSVHISEHRR